MKANVTERQWTIGRNPQPAEPTAMPVIVASEMGMRFTLSGPCSARRDGEGDVDMVYTRGSRRISSATADSSAAASVSVVMGEPPRRWRRADGGRKLHSDRE